GAVGEGVGADVAQVRRVGEAAVRVERQGAVGRPAHEDRGELVPFDIGVVGEYAKVVAEIPIRRCNVGNAGEHRVAVVHGHRGVVNRGDGDVGVGGRGGSVGHEGGVLDPDVHGDQPIVERIGEVRLGREDQSVQGGVRDGWAVGVEDDLGTVVAALRV